MTTLDQSDFERKATCNFRLDLDVTFETGEPATQTYTYEVVRYDIEVHRDGKLYGSLYGF